MKRSFAQLAMIAAVVAAMLTLGAHAPELPSPTSHIGVAAAHAHATGAAPPIAAIRLPASSFLPSPQAVDELVPRRASPSTPIYLRDRVLRL